MKALPNAVAALSLLPSLALAAPIVATDIAPVQSIAARVMQGVGDPGLVIPPGASPHEYALRPSEARLLQDADLVVWVGPGLTPWLADPIDALAPTSARIVLQDTPGIALLPVRTGRFEPDLDDPDAEPAGTGHDHHDAAGAHDGHIWLDPQNAVAAATAIAGELGTLDPANAAIYTANATAFAQELAALQMRISARLAPARGKPFLVFHDGYQYFEHRFDVQAEGSISLQHGVPPGAARVAEIRERVRADGVICAFTEPQFEPKLLATVIEGTGIRTGILDPVGAGLPQGPGLYPALLDALADNLAACLGGN